MLIYKHELWHLCFGNERAEDSHMNKFKLENQGNYMKGGLGNIMKQAQAMQENMQKAQEELANIEVTGQSGAGLIEVKMSCRYDVKKISIDPELMSDDKEILEDLIAAAINDAVRKVEKTTQEKMGGLTSGLNIPGLNLPF